jgi:hypothetical protein
MPEFIYAIEILLQIRFVVEGLLTNRFGAIDAELSYGP